MSPSSSILRQYHLIASISNEMLTHARAGHWELVAVLGRKYQEAVGPLRTIKQLSNEDQHARRGLLEQILRDDADIRDLAAPELKRLSGMLDQAKRQKSAMQAYRA